MTTICSCINETELTRYNNLHPGNENIRHLGPALLAEVVFYIILCIGGTIGNLTVIFSTVMEQKLTKQGNMFVINLAVADLMVSILNNSVTHDWLNHIFGFRRHANEWTNYGKLSSVGQVKLLNFYQLRQNLA